MPRPARHAYARRPHGDTGPRIRPDRRLAWLALVAMLLIFVGPLISQSQRLLEHERAVMPMAQAHVHSTSMAETEEHSAHGGACHHADALAACGYCLLFAHTPGLTPTLALLAATPAPSHARPLASTQLPHGETDHPAFAPRAPPLPLMS
ncbi:Protein of unknown function [Onishia taeanensis]|uniref:DUF2946 family protein n=1 Tax=Onishia taeanensis TaxID=284577 RepID=A0A1G7S9K6_9GAMM|nr:DUF2946 domain-containing protein [Halomonas taeanensis]SDG19673.1 Protein of unknown function [Halomonas taeanensis]